MDVNAWISPALLAVVVAAGAAWLNFRKLKLDLFEKRYALYEEVGLLATLRTEEIRKTLLGDLPESEAMEKLRSVGKKIKFLFDPAIHAAYREVEEALDNYSNVRDELRTGRQEYIQEHSVAYANARMKIATAVNKFRWKCSPALRQYSLFWHNPEDFFVSTYHDTLRWADAVDLAVENLFSHIRKKLRR